MSDNMGMVDPEFQGAGKKEGLKIWRIEKMAVAKVPEKDYGYFFTGDSYIVLHVSVLSPFLWVACSKDHCRELKTWILIPNS